MQWGQIKSLLILSFFILDIYLVAQFLEKKELSDIAIWEEQSSSIEDQLKSEDISFRDLPEEEYEESFISVKQHHFDKDELNAYDSRKQKSLIFQNYLLISKLDKPVKVREDTSKGEMDEMLADMVYESDHYTYWNWNKELNVIIFFQNKKDRTVYYNQNGLVLLYLNEDNEVEYYSQTMLGESENLADKQKLIEPMHAIETLYNSNELQTGDEIENVKIGFHTRVPFDSGVQVFAPVWKVNVNGDKDYFINAIEAFTFSTQEEEFLKEAMDTNIERIEDTKDKKNQRLMDDMVDDFKDRDDILEENGVE